MQDRYSETTTPSILQIGSKKYMSLRLKSSRNLEKTGQKIYLVENSVFHRQTVEFLHEFIKNVCVEFWKLPLLFTVCLGVHEWRCSVKNVLFKISQDS